MTESDSAQYDKRETVRRRDDALRRALSAPPKPHDSMKLGKGKKKLKPNTSAAPINPRDLTIYLS